jgi:predicted DsbA family dithiol-disulfide isomerase
VEVERLKQTYDLDVQFSPFLLDPSTPPEGKPRRHVTQPGEPPTYMEQRGEALGLTYTRGRDWSSNPHYAHEAAEFAEEHGGDLFRYHHELFKAYFTDLDDIGSIDAVVRIAARAGLPEAELREALAEGRYREAVDEGLRWAQEVGVTAVPTFVLDGKFGIVGAQEAQVFEDILQRKLGRTPKI